ncbi:MAG: dihydroorotate dehydrogenase electron transfer subunit [Candidatus Helarchaeota archaeon]|nr:dihydroorotate dehydrogenase electron transfer subunit [Candidatus Helarchaeota archaeon]
MANEPLNRPQMVKISKIELETPLIKTLYFDSIPFSTNTYPGQFIMVWIPRLDEIPLSVSAIEPELAITVKKIGDATNALHALKAGDRIGIRGPYGHGFSVKGEQSLIVGGGIGMAHFLYLINELRKTSRKITVINGARTQSEILFLSKLQQLASNKIECIFTTDDGSYGEKGFASTIASQKLQEESFDLVYTCGPEPMMWDLFQATKKLQTPLEACLERFMKCGIGLCGQCCLDPLGYRVCVEGPVFTSETLQNISDFGKYERDPGGKKIKI